MLTRSANIMLIVCS